MIASHDTSTCSLLKNNIKKPFFNLVDGMWATQDVSILSQYRDYGVRYFDFRVTRDKNKWRMCHGAVEFTYAFDTIEDLCKNMKKTFPKAYYRILLEKGSKKDKELFIEQTSKLGKYQKCDWIVIKKGWETLKNTKFNIVDYTCKLNTAKEILGMTKYGFSIKNWAKKNNPRITDEMILDKDTVYFYDYVNINNNE